MRVNADQLRGRLDAALPSVIVIHGDETFLCEETADMVRQKAREQGYNERDVWHADGRFDWRQIDHATANLSLFSSQKLIEIRLPGGAPGKEGGEWLRQFSQQPPADNVLLLISGKLTAAQQKSKWFTSLDKSGLTVPIWPVTIQQLPHWLHQRMQSRQLTASKPVVEMLTICLEGNLFAAAQEIDKLALLSDNGVIDERLINETVADNARFAAFGLVDVLQQGDARQVPRILRSLQAEGTDVMAVFSAISWAVQRFADMALQLAAGQPAQQIFRQQKPPVWDRAQPSVLQTIKRHPPRRWQQFLQQLAAIDQSAKGKIATDNSWRLLERLCLQIADVRLLNNVS